MIKHVIRLNYKDQLRERKKITFGFLHYLYRERERGEGEREIYKREIHRERREIHKDRGERERETHEDRDIYTHIFKDISVQNIR